MSHITLPHSDDSSWPVSSSAKSVVAITLTAWFALVLWLGASRAFVTPPDTIPFPIAIGVTAPVLVFLIAYWTAHRFRELVLTADLRLVAGIHAWRAAGLGFIALYTYGVLPGAFAWPAGLGDIAIGVTAPWIVLALIRQPALATSRIFVAWNLLGLLDLVVAVGMGALGSGLATGLGGGITTRPMAELPLVLVPAYLVPIFMMLHLTALFQVRHKMHSR